MRSLRVFLKRSDYKDTPHPRHVLESKELPATLCRWKAATTEKLPPRTLLRKISLPATHFVQTELLRNYSRPGHVLEPFSSNYVLV